MGVVLGLHNNSGFFFSFTDKRINFSVSYYITILFVLISVTPLHVFFLLRKKFYSLQIHNCLVWVTVLGKMWKWSVF